MNTAKYAKKPNLSKFTLTPPPPTNFSVLALFAIFALFLTGCPTEDNSTTPETDNRPTYKVTLVQPPQGGTIYANPTQAKKGTKITLSNAPYSGYLIAHYTVNDVPQTNSTFTLTKNVTVSGVFVRDGSETATITFESNGGTAVGSQVVTVGGLVTPRVATREGYTLEGWYKESSLISKWDFATDTATVSRTLYAKWIQNAPDTVTVTFDTCGGPWVSPQNRGKGSSVDQPIEITRIGYTFDNWYGDADYTAYFSFTGTVTENRVIYAKWIPITYSVSYNKNAANATGSMANSAHTYGTEQALNANGFSRDRYTFAGWNTLDDGSGKSYTDGESVKNLTATQGEVVTLYAQWEPVAPTGVSLNKTSISIDVYKKETLTATVAPGNVLNKAVTWKSSNAAVATVANGVVSAVSAGTATITVTTESGGKTAVCTVIVSPTSGVSGNFRYSDTGIAIIITAYTGSGGTLTIPSTIKGLPVTAIADSTSGYGVFSYKNLTSVVIPDSVTTIGGYAFYNNQLTSVTIPNSVTSIGSYAFYDNNLTCITIGANVTLTSGSFGNIGFETVYTANGKQAGTYYRAGNLWSTYISGNFIYEYSTPAEIAIIGYTGSGGAVTIPSTINGVAVTTIGVHAFSYKNLTSVTIPSSVISIGDSAFYNNQLTYVDIPNSITIIGDGAFRANQLISVDIPHSVTTIGDYAFANNKLTGNLIIPNSVTAIGDYAFTGNNPTNDGNQLTSVTLGNSVTDIGDNAFTYNQLTEIVIPNGVTSIGPSAFANNKLTNVVIPNSVTTIEYGAFAYNQLTSITIGANVALETNSLGSFGNIGFESIYNNGGKQAGTYKKSAINYYDVWYTGSFGDFLYTGSTSLTITGYTGTGSAVEIPATIDGVLVVAIADSNSGYGVFTGKNLTSVVIPNSVTSIGTYAFAYNQLTSVTIPNSVTTIRAYAFAGNQLTSVDIPNSVTTIGGYTFRDNPLTSITIGANVSLSLSLLGGYSGFEDTYNDGGKLAGTYTRESTSSTVWVRN